MRNQESPQAAAGPRLSSSDADAMPSDPAAELVQVKERLLSLLEMKEDWSMQAREQSENPGGIYLQRTTAVVKTLRDIVAEVNSVRQRKKRLEKNLGVVDQPPPKRCKVVFYVIFHPVVHTTPTHLCFRMQSSSCPFHAWFCCDNHQYVRVCMCV